MGATVSTAISVASARSVMGRMIGNMTSGGTGASSGSHFVRLGRRHKPRLRRRHEPSLRRKSGPRPRYATPLPSLWPPHPPAIAGHCAGPLVFRSPSNGSRATPFVWGGAVGGPPHRFGPWAPATESPPVRHPQAGPGAYPGPEQGRGSICRSHPMRGTPSTLCSTPTYPRYYREDPAWYL